MAKNKIFAINILLMYLARCEITMLVFLSSAITSSISEEHKLKNNTNSYKCVLHMNV